MKHDGWIPVVYLVHFLLGRCCDAVGDFLGCYSLGENERRRQDAAHNKMSRCRWEQQNGEFPALFQRLRFPKRHRYSGRTNIYGVVVVDDVCPLRRPASAAEIERQSGPINASLLAPSPTQPPTLADGPSDPRSRCRLLNRVAIILHAATRLSPLSLCTVSSFGHSRLSDAAAELFRRVTATNNVRERRVDDEWRRNVEICIQMTLRTVQ